MNSSFLKTGRRLLYLLVICCFALLGFVRSPSVRRTFVFYTYDRGIAAVEDRMLLRSASREMEITRYVEEALLGPVSLDSAPLLTKGTKLRSLLFRNGTVFADFSQNAALPVPEAKIDVLTGLITLNQGIRRNFPYVCGVKLFIEGNEVTLRNFPGNAENKQKGLDNSV